MHDGARKKEFDLILVLALDRLNREGILNTLSYLKVLKQHNVALKSLQERLKLPTKEAFILLLNSYKITDAVEGDTQLSNINLNFFQYNFDFKVSVGYNKKLEGGKMQA